MSKTSVEVDRDIARRAAEILGTLTLRDTIDGALREVIAAEQRLELIDLLAQEDRFDFDAADRAWGRRRLMPRARYLADTSVFSRLRRPPVAAAFRAHAGVVALCAPVAFELGFSARNGEDHDAVRRRLAGFPMVATTDADHRRALEVQGLLAARGHHRAVSLVDALVAAVAEVRELTVLHYDADFELVAAVTGQRHEWVVPRGTAE